MPQDNEQTESYEPAAQDNEESQDHHATSGREVASLAAEQGPEDQQTRYEAAVREFIGAVVEAESNGYTPDEILAAIPNPRIAMRQVPSLRATSDLGKVARIGSAAAFNSYRELVKNTKLKERITAWIESGVLR